MVRTLLFVYGTLKRGLRNHHLMVGQEFLGEAVTAPRYRLIDLGSHPGMVADAVNGLAVKGELWAVSPSCLSELDAFEEVPGPFIRAEVRIAGHEPPAQAYFWNRSIPIGVATGDEWPL